MDTLTACPDRYQSCIDACNRCFQACHECAVLCLKGPDAAERKEHIDTLMNFAEICQEASRSLSMETNDINKINALCTTISYECKKCADICRSM